MHSYGVSKTTPPVTFILLSLLYRGVNSVPLMGVFILDALDYFIAFPTIPTCILPPQEECVQSRGEKSYGDIREYYTMTESVPWCVFCSILIRMGEYGAEYTSTRTNVPHLTLLRHLDCRILSQSPLSLRAYKTPRYCKPPTTRNSLTHSQYL
jgi:hypothetical protein